MMVFQAGWGSIVVHRQQGISKMMACSVVLHLCLFLLVILNRTFFGFHPPVFKGFQVSLVDPRMGLPGSGPITMGGGGRSSSKKRGTKKAGKRVAKASSSSAKQKRSKGTAAKAKRVTPKVAPKSKSGGLPTQSSQAVVRQSAPPVTRTPRRSVTAAVPTQKDPDQLEEWWKKQKKSLKVPATSSASKPKRVIPRTRRTAKIDIQRRPVIAPPPVVSSSSAAQTVPQKSFSESSKPDLQKPDSQKNETFPQTKELETPLSVEEENDFSPGQDEEGTASGEDSGGQGGPESGPFSIQASVGTGTGGIGVLGGTGGGGGSFFFPSFLQKIDQKIRGKWAPPPITVSGDRLVVRFVIRKDGSIDKQSVEIEESSGNPFFDQAAMRAVFLAESFPPLPSAYHENLLTVFMNFVVREDS